MTDERLLKQLNHRLSIVEEDVKTIKEAVSNVSLEKKVGIAIESIENKLEKITDLICSQREPTYHNMASTEARVNSLPLLSSKHQDRDEIYTYASNSNEYIYETIGETSAKSPLTGHMLQSNINCNGSDGSYFYVRTAKHPAIQQSGEEEKPAADRKSSEVHLAVDKKEASLQESIK